MNVLFVRLPRKGYMGPYKENSLQSSRGNLRETEPAVKNLFGILQQYNSILKGIKPPICVAPYASEEAFDPTYKKRQKKNLATSKRASERLHQYLGYRFSIDTLCSSILQIAYMGINLYSKNKAVPSDFSSVITPKVVHFCVGRRVRGVPIGLIIYAGRNQYNHWDEGQMRNPINQVVFDTLATNHGIEGIKQKKEPAFDLKNEMIKIYSRNIVFILEWNSYERYLEDMKDLLISDERR